MPTRRAPRKASVIDARVAGGRVALYRHVDVRGRLLYVGVSSDVLRRLLQHRSTSGWYRRIHRVDVQWFPDRRSALTAEATAIAFERPLWNRARPLRVRSRILARAQTSPLLGWPQR